MDIGFSLDIHNILEGIVMYQATESCKMPMFFMSNPSDMPTNHWISSNLPLTIQNKKNAGDTSIKLAHAWEGTRTELIDCPP